MTGPQYNGGQYPGGQYPPPPPGQYPPPYGAPQQPPPPQKKSALPWILGGLGVALVLGLVITVVVLLTGGDDPPPVAAPPPAPVSAPAPADPPSAVAEPAPAPAPAPTPERSAPDAPTYSTSETAFLQAVRADGLDPLDHGTTQETVDLGWAMCDAFAAGVTLEEAATTLAENGYSVDDSATMLAQSVLHLCPENSSIFD